MNGVEVARGLAIWLVGERRVEDGEIRRCIHGVFGFDEGVSSTVFLGDVDRADLDKLLDLIPNHREP